jgi:hypothetical protein
MIPLQDVTKATIGRKVIYRSEGNVGLPEYATIVGTRGKFIRIQLVGDAIITEARPHEITWMEG